MRAVVWLAAGLGGLCWAQSEAHCTSTGPCYSEGGLVNGASFVAGALAPNTLATLFGSRLAWGTRAITWEDVEAGALPTVLPGTGVRVLVSDRPAQIYFVSPTQVNFLIPTNLTAGEVTIQLVRDATAGPPLRVRLRETAPALFLLDPETVIATRKDFSLIRREQPARPGEEIILWATGLGPTVPPQVYGRIPTAASRIERARSFAVLLDGAAVAPERISYVGVAPGFAGLYQINLTLPEELNENPEVRIAVGADISPPGLRLAARRSD
ncbi:MAG: hypothetical protein RMK57_11015 [Bryobacterales bacterium]|nr:hypothetical protein [Bryobacteraceae bacterium]MDW8355049.1 hypothetical protein [Bryobacterales bacterium]